MFGYQLQTQIDELDWAILHALQVNGRLSFSQIGRQVNASQPTVAERVRRLEERGLITGYAATVNRKLLGWPIMAFVRLTVPNYSTSQVDDIIRGMVEISECHRVTGDDCLIIKLHARSMEHLEASLKKLSRHGPTATSIALSSIVTERMVEPPAEQAG